MTAHVRAYRAAIRFYPRGFREQYGDDLAQLFANLVSDLGPRRAWSRTLLDLVITLPIHRLETIMGPTRSIPALFLIIVALIAIGVTGALSMGVLIALIPLGLGVVIAITQRSNLARSLRPANGSQRRRRLIYAMISGVVFAGSVVGYLIAVSGESISSAALIAYNLVGMGSLVAAGAFLALGLQAPRTAPDATAGAR
jgi:hypothetical protein